MKRVTYAKKALKALSRIPVNEERRIRAKVVQYADDPASQANNVRKLQGMDYYRLRVGDWRVIFKDDGTVIDVIKVAPRGEAYEGIE
ncbi:type II toxin-antitoxin system RelE/ParE family toxin [Agrobacterium sp. a22-2]|uniref:type II toxin-antitoxin system RelE family toxin n=1 Tax=Agrobacterium sp. a22-2 TaxID=2283840 RepID=UPI0014458CCB|nr:type II toxin-antitoxin system RelE/ParE family toxin [Agrobacterium sp. a22-2]NKN39716.1 type II toxin-antitoxin system RelE/ParE family toxin [Agrobacterium sp. a22-2]